jgi:7-carboxy-7-deazaguanine synthase (Cx14CxxC type)
MYTVKEVFFTLQGEGANAGRAAVFCRFTGCNLWNGRESDRSHAVCRFCDTDFVGVSLDGGRFPDAGSLADVVAAKWPQGDRMGTRFVVCTGGEPLLQLDEPLIEAFHRRDFRVAVETNGTQPAPRGIDWICVSPKANANLVLKAGHELKLVYPQPGASPEKFEALEFQHRFLQPMDGPDVKRNTQAAIEYCLAHPLWRLSLQNHKTLGLR